MFEIRERIGADIEAVVNLAEVVRAADGYPVVLGQSGLRGFVAQGDAMQAWVALSDGRVVGHVALHAVTHAAAMDLACGELGVPPQAIGVVARLFVDPTLRRAGLARSLLLVATARSRRWNRLPVLDVVVHFEAAIALYEAEGWNRLGAVSLVVGGSTIDEVIYAAPAIPVASAADVATLLTIDGVAADDAVRRVAIETAVGERRVLVAKRGAVIAGFVVVAAGSFFGRDFIELLVVSESHRRTGVGRDLLNAAVGWATTERVFTSTNESNAPMRSLLESDGWTFSGRLFGVDHDDPELVFSCDQPS